MASSLFDKIIVIAVYVFSLRYRMGESQFTKLPP